MAAQEAPVAEPSDVERLTRWLVSSGAWDEPSARAAAPRLLKAMREASVPCRCRRVGCRLSRRDDRHGMREGYKAGCGCRPCTRANAEYIADWRARSA